MSPRQPVLAAILIAAIGAISMRARQLPLADQTRLAWVATAHQYGPVGYRDPAAAISPDGRWVAFSEGRFLRIQPIGGGPSIEFPPADGQIRHLVWNPNSRIVAANGDSRVGWIAYDRVSRTKAPLWGMHEELVARTREGVSGTTRATQVRQIAWSSDGRSIAGIVDARDGSVLWSIAADGSSARIVNRVPAISFPVWTPSSGIACIVTANGRSRLSMPCGAPAIRTDPDLDVYGPLAVAADGTFFAGMPNGAGTIDLWAIAPGGGPARRLTAFSRDTYAPSVTTDGTVLFKTQVYRTTVSIAAADGGPTRPLTDFQSETPSWDPTGHWIGLTYGTWRRVIDDAKYPDIAQDVGIIAAGADQTATAPARVVHNSESEDQSLCWSPNGQFIAFHSHKDSSDDLWLRPADGNAAATRITFLGRGAETGWPRWSSDGASIVFTATNAQSRREAVYVVGVDQSSGRVTAPAKATAFDGFNGDVQHAEWLPDAQHVVVVGRESPGRHVIFTAAAKGGNIRVVHRFASEHDAPGLAASPDGREAAFIAPASDGFFQVFRLALAGGEPRQITTDRSNKTQPAWSPDGRQIAFTVWNYDAQLWTLTSFAH
jgi:WD40 repeat protein